MICGGILGDEHKVLTALAGLQKRAGWEGNEVESGLRLLKHAAAGTPRCRLLLALHGAVGYLVGGLKVVSTTHSNLQLLLEVVAACCKDQECAVALGLLGGHPLISRLMEHEDETCAELAGEIAGRCAAARGGFPVKRRALDEDIRAHLNLPWRVDFKTDDRRTVSLLLSSVADRMGSQSDTGYSLWPAATILARYLANHSSLVRGKRVLEVGAGLGLCGLVAAHFAAEVTLTDFNVTVLETVQNNVRLNAEPGPDFPHSALSTCGPPELSEHTPANTLVRWLDWDRVQRVVDAHGEAVLRVTSADEGSQSVVERPCSAYGDLDEDADACHGGMEVGNLGDNQCGGGVDDFGRPAWTLRRQDVVIGSDVICDVESARGVARLMSMLLAEDSVGVIVQPFPEHRYGVDALPGFLREYGLAVEQTEVVEAELLQGLDEKDYMRFHLFMIRQQVKAPPTDVCIVRAPSPDWPHIPAP